jgi:hypothetical protein
MAEATKACNLTEDEIKILMTNYGMRIGNPTFLLEYSIERINYLNKRLKAFQEPEETKTETKPAAAGWGTPTT